ESEVFQKHGNLATRLLRLRPETGWGASAGKSPTCRGDQARVTRESLRSASTRAPWPARIGSDSGRSWLPLRWTGRPTKFALARTSLGRHRNRHESDRTAGVNREIAATLLLPGLRDLNRLPRYLK